MNGSSSSTLTEPLSTWQLVFVRCTAVGAALLSLYSFTQHSLVGMLLFGFLPVFYLWAELNGHVTTK